MDEVFAPENAIGKVALKALSRRSDGRGLMQLASHLAALGATGAAIRRACSRPSWATRARAWWSTSAPA